MLHIFLNIPCGYRLPNYVIQNMYLIQLMVPDLLKKTFLKQQTTKQTELLRVLFLSRYTRILTSGLQNTCFYFLYVYRQYCFSICKKMNGLLRLEKVYLNKNTFYLLKTIISFREF